MERTDLLKDLLEYKGNISFLSKALQTFSWDSEELVQFRVAQLATILNRYISGELTATDIESWANLIECREDIGYESAALKEAIHDLANPALSAPLNHSEAKKLLQRL